MRVDDDRLCRAGQLLRDWLDRTKLSQAWLIAQMGISRSMLWKWMLGQRAPHIDNCAQIERLTGIPAATWASRPELRPSPRRRVRAEIRP